jgi:hypothetical protein
MTERVLFAPVFGPFAIFDVCTGRIPANDLSLLVQKRVVAMQKPAVLAVLLSFYAPSQQAAISGNERPERSPG